MKRTLRAATRGSRLALWQTQTVGRLLGVDVEPVVVRTEGDRTQAAQVPLEAMKTRGVFVREVQHAVMDGRADFAVHSAKDMPSSPTPGLALACVPERGDPRDVLIGNDIHDIPSGGVVATSSIRRRAQMAHMRPDLTFATLRGNYDTRMARAVDFDAIVLAAAPLTRLGIQHHAVFHLDTAAFVPQVSQGALGVECREDDSELIEFLKSIEHAESRQAVDAERAFLARLGGGCDMPVGAFATIDHGEITLDAMIASPDGRILLRRKRSGRDAQELGAEIARTLMFDDGAAELLLDAGATVG